MRRLLHLMRLSHSGPYLLLCSQVEIPRLRNPGLCMGFQGQQCGCRCRLMLVILIRLSRDGTYVESRTMEYFEFTGAACC